MASPVKTWLARQPRLAPLRDRVVRLRERKQSYDQRLSSQAARIEGMQKRFDQWSLASARSRVEYAAVAHQIAAFEQRLTDLEAAQVEPGDDPARAEARSIVAEVRAEHARVRARLTMLGAYEERLRRIEPALLHAIKLEAVPAPPNDAVGADVIEARQAGLIAPDATVLPAGRPKKPPKK